MKPLRSKIIWSINYTTFTKDTGRPIPTAEEQTITTANNIKKNSESNGKSEENRQRQRIQTGNEDERRHIHGGHKLRSIRKWNINNIMPYPFIQTTTPNEAFRVPRNTNDY